MKNASFSLLRLNSVFEVAEDTEIDIPQLWKYLGELMGSSAFDGNLGLDVLFKCVFNHVQKHKAARLFACMIQSCEKVNWSVGVILKVLIDIYSCVVGIPPSLLKWPLLHVSSLIFSHLNPATYSIDL